MALLCANKGEGLGADADLEEDVAVWADERKEATVFMLRTA